MSVFANFTDTFGYPNPGLVADSSGNLYVNDSGKKQTIGSVGGGSEGKDNVVIPGATYTSEDKETKVSYKEIDFTTAIISYEDDVLKAMNKNILIKGLKGAILKK